MYKLSEGEEKLEEHLAEIKEIVDSFDRPVEQPPEEEEADMAEEPEEEADMAEKPEEQFFMGSPKDEMSYDMRCLIDSLVFSTILGTSYYFGKSFDFCHANENALPDKECIVNNRLSSYFFITVAFFIYSMPIII